VFCSRVTWADASAELFSSTHCLKFNASVREEESLVRLCGSVRLVDAYIADSAEEGAVFVADDVDWVHLAHVACEFITSVAFRGSQCHALSARTASLLRLPGHGVYTYRIISG